MADRILYSIIDKTTKKTVYVGSTTRGLSQRKKEHLESVKNNSNADIHNYMREHGVENFQFKTIKRFLLVTTTDEDIKTEEVKRIKWYLNHKHPLLNEREAHT